MDDAIANHGLFSIRLADFSDDWPQDASIGQHWIRHLWLHHYVLVSNMVGLLAPVGRDNTWRSGLPELDYGSILPEPPTDAPII